MYYFSLTFIAFIVLFTFFYSLNSVGKLAQLVVLYLLVSLIYIVLDFTFLGLAYIIVYCGAIAIIFLFVIMMISTSKVQRRLGSTSFTVPALLLLVILGIVEPFNEITYSYPQLATIPFALTDLFQFSLLLYIAYPVALVIVAVALLLVLVGLIHLVMH